MRTLPALFLLYALLSCISFYANANQRILSESQVKAMYILNFTQFVEWGKSKGERKTNICLTSDNEINAELVEMINKHHLSEKISITLKDLSSNLNDCNILYISQLSESFIQQILFKTEDLQILTVSDSRSFLDVGGDINLVQKENKLQIYIHNTQIKSKNMFVSSELLDIAREVR